MLRTVKIENFRGFQSFELHDLGRVNLLVGKNNSGKTSVLEAIQLLCSRNNLEPLRDAMKSRGEYFRDERKEDTALDIRHLFYNHEIQLGSKFSISGENESNLQQFLASIGKRHILSNYQSESSDGEGFDASIDDFKVLEITARWIYGEEQSRLQRPLSSDGGLLENHVRFRRTINHPDPVEIKTNFVKSSSLTAGKMIELFDGVVLTPEEKLVLESLQIIEPRIERIASVSSEKYRYSEARGGFVLLLDDNRRVPIGSMGDGTWRMLGLALAMVGSRDGFLFVDEIDTGLHFTAMSDMWKLIWETSKRLNVQVFATTHSNDCWTSLASIADREDAEKDGITIQRIERGKTESVVFNERGIVIAANREIEVR